MKETSSALITAFYRFFPDLIIIGMILFIFFIKLNIVRYKKRRTFRLVLLESD